MAATNENLWYIYQTISQWGSKVHMPNTSEIELYWDNPTSYTKKMNSMGSKRIKAN